MKPVFKWFERYVDVSDWWGEVLFGLMMVLIFTIGARSAVASGEDTRRDVLVAVIGCNIGWGALSAWMFVLDTLFERSRKIRLVRAVQEATSEESALVLIRGELDEDLEAVVSEAERQRLSHHILENVKAMQLPKTRVTRADLCGAIIVFFLVALTTVPAVVPFLFIEDLKTALRVSNLLLVSMLFFVGYRWAGETNTNPWVAGASVLVVGLALSIVAELLGG
jgi:VIT1/CCC1 family predicted Fe2+/Mn2+ transporter